MRLRQTRTRLRSLLVETVEQPIGERVGAGLTPKIALALVSAALGVVLVFAVLYPFLNIDDHDHLPKIFDLNNLRGISGSLIGADPTPFVKDGRLDVYGALRSHNGDDEEYVLMLCTSARTGRGPTWEMIQAGDYSRFPYERAKGPIREGDKSQLLLWDREPDEDGNRLVARGDGSVWRLTEDEFQIALRAEN